jgi:hypothetical protein
MPIRACTSSERVRIVDLEPGAFIHLGPVEGLCHQWQVVSNRQIDPFTGEPMWLVINEADTGNIRVERLQQSMLEDFHRP